MLYTRKHHSVLYTEHIQTYRYALNAARSSYYSLPSTSSMSRPKTLFRSVDKLIKHPLSVPRPQSSARPSYASAQMLSLSLLLLLFWALSSFIPNIFRPISRPTVGQSSGSSNAHTHTHTHTHTVCVFFFTGSVECNSSYTFNILIHVLT